VSGTDSMRADVLAQPEQLGDALWRAQSAGIPNQDRPGGLIVCGMGGSAIGGDLAAAALGDRATRPITIVRGYALESWTGPDSLVLCASYSGNTEETLACFEAAGAAGAGRVALTTGGKLAELARAEGVPVIGVPAGMQPRAAVIYMIVGVLECAALCGAAPGLHSEIDTAAELLRTITPADAEPLAEVLHGTVPIVHGAGPTVAIARRWKTQINENAKAAAFFSELPESNHNEICFWQRGAGLGRFSGVFLEDPDQHPRIRRRIDLTAAEVELGGAPAVRVPARGETRLERLLSLVMLGDLVSVRLAELDGVDADEIEALVRLKDSLSDKP
jgi:glucose/mannose-6-phosphate isomerase